MEKSRFLGDAKSILESAKGKKLSIEERCQAAINLTQFMLNEAKDRQTHAEKSVQKQLAGMMNDPVGKVFTTSMTDQCFRSQSSRRVTNQLIFLLKRYGIPKFLSPLKQVQLTMVKWFGKTVPGLIVPLFKRTLRQETNAVIMPGENDQLTKHIIERKKEGVRINLNHLGEAILGEREAKARLHIYLDDLKKPEIECVSVKISTIFSQINLLAWDESLEILDDRLSQLYKLAAKHPAKLVYLDMEEYRDLQITVELFQRVLNKPEFFTYSAGIVLQSYLPDSHVLQKELTAWAMQRVASGGAPIKIRIVKGANLSMEKVEASTKCWAQAPYTCKADVDANYKRMVEYGCQKNHAKAVKLGIASHNLFDIAYAMLLRTENEVENYVGFEMLEGMADHIRRVVQEITKDMLLYCPSATKEEFVNAVAYLMRRLDENTAPENFLRQLFDLSPGTEQWKKQAESFKRACKDANHVEVGPRRRQNRLIDPEVLDPKSPFVNEADTDWSLPQNRIWVAEKLREWSQKKIETIPLVISGKEMMTETAIGIDPSYPDKEYYRYSEANTELMNNALETAERQQITWGRTSVAERAALVKNIAHEMKKRRGRLIGAMVTDCGKTIAEADVEISEAIDFAEYYSRQMEELNGFENIKWRPKGTILVAPPWNFPCSIPLGGISGALVTGNCVLFKPSPEAVLVGWTLANICWDAGISKEVLQFVPCPDDPVGTKLIKDPRLNGVILTGATATAKMMLKLRPGLDLMAETGGKNAIIISNMSDRDLAIRDLIHSAFSHSGQKCSACSLAICLPEIYDDPHFRMQLLDAAQSWKVGSPWNFSTRINPLIREPNPTLLRGLTTLDRGEEWLLKPKQDPKNPNLWSPGIKLGVKPGSFMHQNELFGPVLGVMRAKNLDQAIQFANGTPYGLTSGLHSLDEREQKKWAQEITAGNLYINRTITGAIVRRQPFGGCKESSFGEGAKAGGPNYLMSLMIPIEQSIPKENSYLHYWNNYFRKDHDPSQVMGQDNILRYVSQSKMVLRVQEVDSLDDVDRVIEAAQICHTPLVISDYKTVSDEQFINFIKILKIKRIRFLSEPSEKLKCALAEEACNIIQTPVVSHGRIELSHYLREVSLSFDYHRYGNLGERE